MKKVSLWPCLLVENKDFKESTDIAEKGKPIALLFGRKQEL